MREGLAVGIGDRHAPRLDEYGYSPHESRNEVGGGTHERQEALFRVLPNEAQAAKTVGEPSKVRVGRSPFFVYRRQVDIEPKEVIYEGLVRIAGQRAVLERIVAGHFAVNLAYPDSPAVGDRVPP